MTEEGDGSPVVILSRPIAWDAEADVVVVGTGIAANAVALHCADAGLAVIMLEKAPTPGGTSAKAAGGAMVPNNRYLRDAGSRERREDFARFLGRVGRPLLYDEADPHLGLPRWEFDLIEAYFDHAAASWERLEELGAVRTVHTPGWASYNVVPEDKQHLGRVMFQADDDGNLTNGRAAIARAQAKAKQLGVDVELDFRVDGVVLNGHRAVVGVRGIQDGRIRTIRGRRAVVFATGGFPHNEEYAKEYLNGMFVGGCAARTSTGDIIPIMQALGVPLIHMDSAWGAPLVLERALDKDPGLISNFSLIGDSVLSVNKYGRRVVNEKITYHDRTQSHFVWDPYRTEYPNFLQFAIFDERTRLRYARSRELMDHEGGNFIPPLGQDSEYVVRGDSLTELAARFAERLGRRAASIGGIALAPDFTATLRATIERYNEFAVTGVDLDFHRGESAIELNMHGGRAEDNPYPNETMHPLADEGPYYGTILAPGAIDTKGGPKVNPRFQILDGLERPVPGLYGIGNCVASASGQSYWSGGSTWGPYVAFGLAAARSIVQEPERAAS